MIVLYQPEIKHYSQLHYIKINPNKKNYLDNIKDNLNNSKKDNVKENSKNEDEEIVLAIKNILKNYKQKIIANNPIENIKIKFKF